MPPETGRPSAGDEDFEGTRTVDALHPVELDVRSGRRPGDEGHRPAFVLDGGFELPYCFGDDAQDRLIEELGLPEDYLEGVVRESFEFLLEREPASSIMSEFSLDVIPAYFPEYREELPKRL